MKCILFGSGVAGNAMLGMRSSAIFLCLCKCVYHIDMEVHIKWHRQTSQARRIRPEIPSYMRNICYPVNTDHSCIFYIYIIICVYWACDAHLTCSPCAAAAAAPDASTTPSFVRPVRLTADKMPPSSHQDAAGVAVSPVNAHRRQSTGVAGCVRTSCSCPAIFRTGTALLRAPGCVRAVHCTTAPSSTAVDSGVVIDAAARRSGSQCGHISSSSEATAAASSNTATGGERRPRAAPPRCIAAGCSPGSAAMRLNTTTNGTKKKTRGEMRMEWMSRRRLYSINANANGLAHHVHNNTNDSADTAGITL